MIRFVCCFLVAVLSQYLMAGFASGDWNPNEWNDKYIIFYVIMVLVWTPMLILTYEFYKGTGK